MLSQVPDAGGPELDALLGECDARSYALTASSPSHGNEAFRCAYVLVVVAPNLGASHRLNTRFNKASWVVVAPLLGASHRFQCRYTAG